MAAKDYKKAKKKAGATNIAPFPVHTLAAYNLAADTLYNDVWNLVIDEVNADMPADWAIGTLHRVIIEIQALDYEE